MSFHNFPVSLAQSSAVMAHWTFDSVVVCSLEVAAAHSSAVAGGRSFAGAEAHSSAGTGAHSSAGVGDHSSVALDDYPCCFSPDVLGVV